MTMSLSKVHERIVTREEVEEMSPAMFEKVLLSIDLLVNSVLLDDPLCETVGWMMFCECFDLPYESKIVDIEINDAEDKAVIYYTIEGEDDEV